MAFLIRAQFLLLGAACLLRAQIALVSTPPKVSIADREIPALTEPAALNPQFTVIVALDTLLPEDFNSLRPYLLQLYASRTDKSLFNCSLFYSGGFQPLGPYRNQAAMDKDLKQQLKIPDEKPLPDSLRFYTSLLSAPTPLPEQGWSTVVYAARFPALPAELRDYADAWLARAFAARRIRPLFWTPDETPAFPSLSRQFRASLDPDPGPLLAASWTAPPMPDGFHLLRLTLTEENQPPLETMDFAQLADFPLPSLSDYLKLRQAVASRLPLDQLTLALTINPRDPEGIRLAADQALELKDLDAAIRWLKLVTEEEPQNPIRWRELANSLYDLGPQVDAESALSRAHQLNPGDPRLAERYGRVRLALRDIPGALALFDKSLSLDSKNEALWWICADLARDTRDESRELQSLERALALNGSRLDRRTRAITLLLKTNNKDKARSYVQAVSDTLPPQVPVLTDFAQFHEQLSDPPRALSLWRQTFSIDPAYERGYYETTRLLIDAKNHKEALTIAVAGIEKIPDSVRLHLARASLLEYLGQPYESRRHLASAASRLTHMDLLQRRASQEDLYGKSAAEAYQALAEAQEKAKSPHLANTLSRGLTVALRDNDRPRITWFQRKLPTATSSKPKSVLTLPPSATSIPGGPDGLAFAARMKKTSSSATFFNEYTHTIASQFANNSNKLYEAFRDEILTYLSKVHQLETFGSKVDDTFVIELSVRDKNARRNTERLVEFLGYKLKTNGNKISLDAGEKKQQARKQDILNALGLDPVGMEEAIEAGKDYKLEFESAPASILFGEVNWVREFASKGLPTGGFAAFLAQEPSIAKLYAGLSAAEPKAAELLATRIGLRKLSADNLPDLLFAYGSSLALNAQGQPVVPGGEAARDIWQSLTQASPSDPAQFYLQLLNRDDGKLFAFFSALGQLQPLRQRFFTRNVDRTAAYYNLFKDSPEMKIGAGKRTREAPFLDFLREVPIGADLTVAWPGSPEVWTVAKGNSSLDKTQRMMRKVDKAVAPAAEDEILLKLARLRYGAGGQKVSQVDNFLAVARIDAQRKTPLTETEALLLAQSFNDCGGIYPYFARFSELREQDFTRFFRFAARVKDLKDLEANHLLAHFYAVTELLDLLRVQGRLTPQSAASLFSDLSEKLGGPGTASTWAISTASVLEATLKAASAPDSTDNFWIDALAGPPQLNHREDITKVLTAQKAPDLSKMLALVRHARQIATKPAEAAVAIEKLYAEMPRIELTKNQKFRGELRQMIENYNAAEVPRLLLETKKKAANKKPNPKDFEKLSGELLEALAPPLALAALSLDYAYFLRPMDLSAMEDPLLVRKHEFVELNSNIKQFTWFPNPAFDIHEQEGGGFGRGSLSGLGYIAGKISRAGQASSGASAPVQVMQTAALRAAPLWQLTTQDLRAFKLRTLAAREWVVEASRDDTLRQQLDTALTGLIAPNRRSRLNSALAAGEIQVAWELLSLSDLYWIGTRIPGPTVWTTPLQPHLEAYKPEHLHLLGSHTTFEPLPPYEDYELIMIPDRLAERVSEFKLSLVWLADHEGISSLQLSSAADGLLNRALSGLKMVDLTDWSSALKAWDKLHPSWLETTK